MTDKNDLKPGDIVQHHRWGNGVVTATSYGKVVYYAQLDLGTACSSSDLTGWERVEIVKPGHVQVRVDDLDLEKLRERLTSCDCLFCLIDHRVCAAANPEPPQPDEPTGLGAVVEVGGKRFVRTDEDGHPWIDNVAYWHTWDEITARGPVTVLSEGLAS